MMEAKSEEYETDDSGSDPGKPSEDDTFFTKRLPANAFSHYESREEVRLLDYTPTINVRWRERERERERWRDR